MVRKGYKRLELTFAESDESEMELWNYIENKAKDNNIGKTKLIKNMIHREMRNEK